MSGAEELGCRGDSTIAVSPRRHRRYQLHYDRIAHRQRWGIENFFARLKQWRRIATRYDKLAKTFSAFVKIASIMAQMIKSSLQPLSLNGYTKYQTATVSPAYPGPLPVR